MARQIERAHVKAITDLRAKARGLNGLARSGRPASADEPGEQGPAPAPGHEPLLNALTAWLAAVAKGKGGKGKGGGKGNGGNSGRCRG